MRLVDLDYPLPPELIAQERRPNATVRDSSSTGGTEGYRHLRVSDLPGCLKPRDLLARNDTRVVPAPAPEWREESACPYAR